MNRETKVLIGVGGLAAIGLILALGGHMTVGLLVLAIGLIAGFAGLRLTRPDTSDPFADARSEADQTNTGTLTPNEPLTAWAPEGGLSAWTPPVDLAPLAPTEPYPATPELEPEPYPATPDFEPEPASSWNDTNWDSTVSWPADPAPVTEAPAVAPSLAPAPAPAPVTETNPLDDLVGLEALDPIAEVERIESRESATTDSYTGFTPFDAPVNENVTGADDIMAASQATELNLADGEQTELQKLLAKVQIRLSAYE